MSYVWSAYQSEICKSPDIFVRSGGNSVFPSQNDQTISNGFVKDMIPTNCAVITHKYRG